jgi:4-hydroxy-tetrahydrodipicolinate reductase
MAIRILVNGASGKMGQLSVQTLSAHSDFDVVGKTGHQDDLAKAIKESRADVVLDFTTADVVLKNAEIILNAGVHPVIGTTGLIKEQIEALQAKAAKLKLGGLIVPNFSLGAVLVMKYAQAMAAYFPDVEIIEMHHPGKLDSPSGTAIYAAQKIAAQRKTKSSVSPNAREIIPGARGASYENIPLHAIRLPGLVAHLKILFGGKGETVTLQHDTIDRQCFMPGVILACQKVIHLNTLLYGLETIL